MAVVLWKPLEVLASLEKTLPQLQVRLKIAVINQSGFLGFVDLADNGCPLQIYAGFHAPPLLLDILHSNNCAATIHVKGQTCSVS